MRPFSVGRGRERAASSAGARAGGTALHACCFRSSGSRSWHGHRRQRGAPTDRQLGTTLAAAAAAGVGAWSSVRPQHTDMHIHHMCSFCTDVKKEGTNGNRIRQPLCLPHRQTAPFHPPRLSPRSWWEAPFSLLPLYLLPLFLLPSPSSFLPLFLTLHQRPPPAGRRLRRPRPACRTSTR